jgi:predicted nuclease of predicted toxin-antitoxin system
MSRRRSAAPPDALLLDEMFSPTIAEQLRGAGIDCVAIAAVPSLTSQDDPAVLDMALSTSRVLVTNNVVDFERLRTQRAARDEPNPPLIYTADTTFPRNRKFIGRLVEALEHAAKNRLVHATGGVLWLATPPTDTPPGAP